MTYSFLDIALTPKVKEAQAVNGSASYWADFQGHRRSDRFTEAETEFISTRDSFYMATVSETGWPYVQYRGGPEGFLHVLDERTLAFADFRGNRQYISIGNLDGSGRTSLILMDYPSRSRLKIFAHTEVKYLSDVDSSLLEKLIPPDYKAKPERVITFHLEAFDWNCPQHITPRFTELEIAEMMSPIKKTIANLEQENQKLKNELTDLRQTLQR